MLQLDQTWLEFGDLNAIFHISMESGGNQSRWGRGKRGGCMGVAEALYVFLYIRDVLLFAQ